VPPRPSIPTLGSPRSPEGPGAVPPPTVGGPPHFSLFGIPVRIGFGFWIMSIMLGMQGGIRAAMTWALVVFVSVMLHELGHALVARAFGARPSITLHALGGLTHHGVRFSRPRNILVALAGPFAGFALGFAVLLATRHRALPDSQQALVDMVLFVNIGWGLMNLMPVMPLDGGHVLRDLLGPKRALAAALISATVGLGIAILALVKLQAGGVFVAFIFGSAGLSSLAQARVAFAVSRDRRAGLENAVIKAREMLGQGRVDDAFVLADDVVRRARTAPVKNGAYTALAWAHVARGEGQKAREALMHIEPRGAIDPYTLAAVEDAAGESRRARDLLDEARRVGLRSPDMTKLHIDLYARDGKMNEVAGIAIEDARLLSRAEGEAIVEALVAAEEPRLAEELAGKLAEIHGQAERPAQDTPRT
jgi:Zn-dependent protease